jgi:hypothetical protein
VNFKDSMLGSVDPKDFLGERRHRLPNFKAKKFSLDAKEFYGQVNGLAEGGPFYTDAKLQGQQVALRSVEIFKGGFGGYTNMLRDS